MKCPACGAAELVSDTRDVPFTYKGETTTIPAVTGDFCPACAESVLDMAQARHFGDQVSDFIKQVNAFTRYETGKTRPPLALVTLLKLLDRHPELMDEVRAA